jgi:outer membrane protein insertion porin family
MYKFFFLIFLFLNTNLSGEIVKKLDVKGNSRISDETIKVYGEIVLNEDYTSLRVDEILKNLYRTDFFDDVKVSISNEILSITVKEYAIINSIDLQGEDSNRIKNKILEGLELQVKQSFIESKVASDKKKLKRIYAGIGFNFVTVESKIQKFSDNRVNLVYSLTKGSKSNIAKISFNGDKKLKAKKLREIIASEEKKFWKILSRNTFLSIPNIELDKRLLINYYKSLGYYDVQVLSNNAEISKDNFTTLIYTINAGTRYRVNKISTNVSAVLDKKLFLPLEKYFSKVIGKYYSPFKVKKLLDELDVLIADNDLQFIEHSVNEILEDGNVEIKINIYEGKKQLVEKINILGNTVTDESVIRSELILDEGDPFNSLKLEQSIARIKGRNIFGLVEAKVIDGLNKDQKVININIEEKPTGEISAGAGIGTNGGTVSFAISENNWLGRGINVVTSLDASAETFTGGLSITNPNYNYTGNSLTVFASNSTNDKKDAGYKNTITTGGIGTRFEQYKNIYLSPNLKYTYDDLKVENSASDSLKKQKGSFSDLIFDYSIQLDNRNRTFAPTEGYSTSFGQELPFYSQSPFLANSYDLKTYKTFSKEAIGSFKFYVATINGLNDEDVRVNRRINLPSSRLRGFEAGKVGPVDGVDFIGGNYAAVTNFDLKLPNLLPEATKLDVGVFLDVGNLWEVDYDSSLNDSNKLRSSTGINANWSSPLGPMSFVFSQNISKASTDVTEGFNFNLGTSF